MICPYCGSQIADDNTFCPHCGGPQKEDEKKTAYGYHSGGPESDSRYHSSRPESDGRYHSGGPEINGRNNSAYTSGSSYTNTSNSNAPAYQKFNGMCIAGFVLSFFVSILGLIFSAVGYKQATDRNEGGRGLAIAGLILSIVFICVKIITYFASGCLACSMYGWYL